MPLTKEMIAALPHLPGVYIYLDSLGKELYIGKAKDLRKRVAQYPTNARKDIRIYRLVDAIVDIRYIECADEIDALITEARLIREIKPPFNIALKDSDSYPWLEVTLGDDFPKVQITRSPDNRKSRYIGPFTDVYALRVALRAVQPIFRFCTCGRDLNAGKRYRPCLNYNLRLCDAPCAGRISREDYRKNIKALILFFSGGKQRLIAAIKAEMEKAAAEYRYEEAAVLRDQVKAMEKLSRPSELQKEAVTFVDLRPDVALKQLKKALNLPHEPVLIEGYDISNLGDESAVGSLVSFANGMPNKDGYRRYRIKTVPGQDDFAMLAEVLRRRLRRVKAGDGLSPSLILIDGGQGQVNSVGTVMAEEGLAIPVIGLAKQFEIVHFADGRPPLELSRNNAGLRLLQQVRDEAHRFAQHYHHLLRAKRVFGASYTPKPKKRKKKPGTEGGSAK